MEFVTADDVLIEEMGGISSNVNKMVFVEKVIIKNLFGMFNYTIDYCNKDNVSIFIAPNGCGKTTIFNFIDFCLNPEKQSYEKIFNIPIDKFECCLSNGITITYKKAKKGGLTNYPMFNYIYTLKEKGKIIKEVKFYEIDFDNSRDEYLYKKMQDNSISEEHLDEIMRRHRRKIILKLKNQIKEYCLLKEYCLSVTYITANRLFESFVDEEYPQYIIDNEASIVKYSPAYRRHIIEKEKPEEVILKYCKQSQKIIQNTIDEYRKLAEDVKNRLPKLFLEYDKPVMTRNDFIKRWKKYLDKIYKFEEAGIYVSGMTSSGLLQINISKLTEKMYNEQKGVFLSLYLQEYENILYPLQNLCDKINIFTKIINQRNEITNKVILFSMDEGIKIIGNNNTKLSPTQLSSGEKNDFVMFYKLIFSSNNYGVVLIDEPEISLHIEWQESFIDNILKICKMNGLQAIIATHSPNIINDHLDLLADSKMEKVANEK